MKKLFHFDAPREKYHCRDANAEAVRHERELHRAAANLRAAIPDVEVQGCFVDFEGSPNAGIGIGKGFQEEATLA